MKNTHFVIILLFLFPVFSYGQLYPLKPETNRIVFKVISSGGQLGVQYDSLPKIKGFPEILSITFEDADLVVHYKYKGHNKKYTPDVVKIISIQSIGERPVLPERRDLQQYADPISTKKGMEGSIKWLDLAEEELTFGESYILTIERNIRLDVNCEAERPQFKFKEQWPHYAIAGGAVASIAVGQIYRQKKEEENDLYQDAWKNGEPGIDAKTHFDKAEEYDTNAKVFTIVGWGILAADVVWGYYRRKDKKRKQKLYDLFCIGNKDTTWDVNPLLEFNSVSSSSATNSAGLQLLVRF